ncbi:MAG: 50S ribosomal protein L11 [Elusimicrobia bacterium]|nr:50S ribosomal protein L11 [Elusimicrobiota bacterium]
MAAPTASKKKIKTLIKLQVPAGQANPAPPIGPALGQHGVNIMDFCKRFNEKTKTNEPGMTIPCVITVYEDRSFDFITKMPPVSALLKKTAQIAVATGTPGRAKSGSITKKQLEEVARAKMVDLNADTIEAAMRLCAGTARSMGLEIV